MPILISNIGAKTWKKEKAKKPFLFSKKFQKPLDRFISIVYNKDSSKRNTKKRRIITMTNEMLAKELGLTVAELEEIMEEALAEEMLEEMAEEAATIFAMEKGIALW